MQIIILLLFIIILLLIHFVAVYRSFYAEEMENKHFLDKIHLHFITILMISILIIVIAGTVWILFSLGLNGVEQIENHLDTE